MRVLIPVFHASFWLSIGAFACVIAGLLLPSEQHPSVLAVNGLLALVACMVVYALAVGALADKFGRSGAGLAIKSLVFGPVGAVMSYVEMSRVLRSKPPAEGSLVPRYTADQKAGHKKLLVIFIVVLVLGNVVARLLQTS